MGIYSVVISLLLAIFIVINEITRKKSNKNIEILTFINIIFFICFSLVPFLVYFYFENLHIWTQKNDINEIYYFMAVFYALISYIAIIFAYKTALKFKYKKLNLVESGKKNFHFSLIVTLVGWVFLVIFIQGVGGISNFFTTNTLYRGGNIEVSPVAFSRNLALFIPVGSFIMFYNVLSSYSKYKYRNWFLLIVNFLVSLAIFYNRSGRLSLIIYIVTFFIIYSLFKKRNIYIYLVFLSPAILWFISFGKSMFNYFFIGNFNVNNKSFDIESILSEFTFPFFTLANAIKFPFFQEEPRLFIDFLYGVANLLPSAFIPIQIPKTVTMLNTESFGNISGIPIDLVSLGFHSFGIAGIMIISLAFGFASGYTQKKLLDSNVKIIIVFYAQFIFFFALRVSYAEPTNFLKSNFSFLIVFVVFLLLYKKRGK
ncbi:hypothetical protein CSV71_02255 [Sporosarcina sp. P21c]|uniref:O-antigen polymerase n=1 Tax=Sporosarcina sp. P21c TaxID=2048255 RepID=UPI000C16CFEB|nr:O-antigen polymerase [Sporosarcina sp. P21c]PIC90899.1 hypothetical protein CSV71_02255 [Sporosarcina sp. P21c]